MLESWFGGLNRFRVLKSNNRYHDGDTPYEDFMFLILSVFSQSIFLRTDDGSIKTVILSLILLVYIVTIFNIFSRIKSKIRTPKETLL
jgi:hypothetical protein